MLVNELSFSNNLKTSFGCSLLSLSSKVAKMDIWSFDTEVALIKVRVSSMLIYYV